MEYLRRKFTNLGLYKLIMTFCLIFIAGVNSVYAEEAEPKVTITLSDMTLREAFTQIEEVIDFRFFYDENSFDVNKKVSIKANEWPLKKVITTLLKGTGMTFKINERQIVLLHEEKEEVVKRTVTGIITDINGEPLIGASVVVEGTSNGTITDFDGNFSIMAPEGSNLVFSYVGYRDYIASVKGDKAMNISLEEDSQVLSDVVVTALGIKREKKMLGYSVQDLKSDEINTTGDASITSALQGKVAGLQMNTSSTGLGGSTKITIRGNSSFTDDNQPLWIVDGVPFTDNQSSDASAYGGYDRGGTSFDINPDDIESISVLKGPNAAALYGSRAGNGVILITTKKGSKKDGFGVNYNGTFTWSIVGETLEMQKKYGQGNQGKLVWKASDEYPEVPMPEAGDPDFDQKMEDYNNYVANRTLSSHLSFGPEYDGSMVRGWNGQMTPYSYQGDKLKDYFDNGFAQFHSVAIGTGNENSHFRASFGFNGNDGLFKDESLDKLTADINAGSKINKYLSLDAKTSLSHMEAVNRPLTGLNGEIAQLLLIPGNVSLDGLKNYQTADRLHGNWFGPDMQYSNPYYVRRRYQNSDERWRVFGYFGAKINVFDWLNFSAKYAYDYYRTRIKTTDLGLAYNAIGEDWASKITDDSMNREEENYFEHNIEFMFNGDKHFNDNFRLGYTLGSNIMYQQFETFGAGVRNMISKEDWIFNTGEYLVSANEGGHKRAMYSVFASVQLAWKEYLALDLTARNDWSSTLPVKNNSFFYPSANLSFVISDFVNSLNTKMPLWITFTKLRLSAAQVGKDPAPYKLYNVRQYKFENGTRLPIANTIKNNSNLKPEIKSSYEAGLDMKFFQNKLGFDFTYYYSTTKNQAMLVKASAPWTEQWINAGEILNHGFEMMIYSTPYENKDFRFDLDLNLAKNISKVKSLADGVDHIYFNGDPNMPIQVGAVAGGSLGDIYAKTLIKRDSQGNVIVGSDGLPQNETGNGNLEQYLLDHPIGNINPDLLMSVTPSFNYKGISVSAMFDFKFGGDVVCMSEGMATSVGLAKRTEDRGEFKEVNGVEDFYMIVDGVKEDGTLNDIPVSAQKYYSTIGLYKEKGYAEEFIYDASYIKLKELSVGYSFPRSILKKTPFSSLKLSFVGRNLCYLHKNTPGNPDGGYDTSMFSQALDYLSVPYTRTFGFSINVGF